eukprot:COSAG06_NODE_5878_length_3231_cov_2.531609_2_plen_84_part_00
MHVAVMRINLCTWPSLQAGPGQRGRAPGGRHSLNPGGHHPLWRLQRDRAGLGKQNKTKQNKTIQFRFSFQLITIHLFTMGRLN